MIQLRPARLTDSKDLFAWRNDPQTQAASRSTAPVAQSDHDRWMEFNIGYGYPEHLVFMADTDFGSVGVIRFDGDRGDVMTYSVSITVSPQYRGHGYGREMLRSALPHMSEFRIDAEVRSENFASRHLFEGAGFTEIGDDHGIIKYRKEPAR